jgi:hypothetical protein
MSGLAFGALLIAAGFVVYWATSRLRKDGWSVAALRQKKAA